MYEERFSKAINSDNITEALRELALEMKNEGLNQKSILDIFNDFYLFLEEEDRNESEYVWDVMDMISGWYVGRNIDFT